MSFRNLAPRVSSLEFSLDFGRIRTTVHKLGAGCRSVAPLSFVPMLLVAALANAATVKDYGAKGDGNTNDSPAIQNAINATSSGMLVFPAGTYKLSSPLYLKGNITYQGQGSPILTGTNGGSIFIFPQSSANNITITGLTFDNGQIRTEGNNEVPKNIKITGNVFQNLTVQSSNWTLKSAIFGSNGMSQSSIDHNVFSNIMVNGKTRPDGTINSIEDFATGVFMYGLDRTAIVNNTFNTVGEGIKVCFTQTYASQDINIAYNTFDKLHRMGMELQDANGCGHQNTITPTTNLTVEYNDIHLNNDPYWNSFGISIAMPPAVKPIVRNNRIVGELPIALNVPGIGIEAGGQSAQVYGNTVEGYYDLAIGIFGGSTNVQYHDNYACSLGSSRMFIGDEHGPTPNESLYNNKIVAHCPSSGIPNPIVTNPPPVVSISVAPSSATVNAGGQQSFSAPVSGTGNTGVTWSLSNAIGSINSAGVYTAPANVATAQTVSVIAISSADPSKKASATVTIYPPIVVDPLPDPSSAPPNPPTASLPKNGMMLWLANDKGVVLNGQAVAAWEDESGNGNDAVQSKPANQPMIVNGNNGQKALHFDGKASFLTIANLPVDGLSGMSVFIVSANTIDMSSRVTNAGAESSLLYWPETAWWGSTFFGAFQTSSHFRFGTTQVNNNPAYSMCTTRGGSFGLGEWIHNGTSDTMYLNGQNIATFGGKQPAIAGVGNVAFLGQGYQNTFFPGDVSEVIVYNRALTNAERITIEQYLSAKYHL